MPSHHVAGHYAARFYDASVPGQIGLQERHYIIVAKSLAAAKRAAKSLLDERGHTRLGEVFPIEETEREQFRRNGWYVNVVEVKQ